MAQHRKMQCNGKFVEAITLQAGNSRLYCNLEATMLLVMFGREKSSKPGSNHIARKHLAQGNVIIGMEVQVHVAQRARHADIKRKHRLVRCIWKLHCSRNML